MYVNLQEKGREGEEERKREEIQNRVWTHASDPSTSNLKQEDCVVETASLNYAGKSCLRNLKKKKTHKSRGRGGGGMESRGGDILN